MIKYNIHHIKGLYFQITDDEGKNREYDVSFVDRADNKEIYKCKMKVGHWAQLSRKYLSDICVIVRFEGRAITQVNFLDLIKGKRVFISFESKALGDTLAWLPYCREFAKHYDCKVIVSTFKNFLFEKKYPDLEFVDRGVSVPNLIAMLEIGWYWEKEKEPVNPILIPLQQSATNILNLPYKEVIPDIDFTPTERPIQDKYVCISIYSTSQCKLWYYWQDVIDFLTENGYKVIEISKENNMMYQRTDSFSNLIEMQDKSLESTMNHIYHSEFYIGLSSGLSWLAWSLRKKVYMISNFTNKEHEFNINTIRIVNESVCNSCWHDLKFRFDKSNWMWCPRQEDTPRHFECHKKITSEQVINTIKENEKI
jgi:autotransporter strand-loop-strand O-heptosyltransferase